MRITSIWIIIAMSVGLLATQSGCLLVAAGAGAGAGVAYVRGDTETVVDGDAKAVTAASEKAAKDMDLTVISSSASSLDGKVVARTGSDTRVTIVVKAQGEKASSISIRVGNFGDDVMQGALLEKIKANLKSAGATASTADADTAD